MDMDGSIPPIIAKIFRAWNNQETRKPEKEKEAAAATSK
jgi:hypothetical protein